MTRKKEPRGKAAEHADHGGVHHLEFGKDIAFQVELRRRVDDFFEATGRRKRDCWQMHLKTAIILACFAIFYWLLVFEARTLWQGLTLAVLLGMTTALIGFNIQHDAGHHAYSERRWVNRAMAMTLDMIGGSSFVWRWKHAVIHHMYVNIAGYDSDIDIGPMGRFCPHQRRLWFHRWQRFYLWPLYGLEALKLQLRDDFQYVITGRLGVHRIARPRGWELAGFIAGKAVFISLAFVIPILRHGPWVTMFYYVITAVVTGIVMVLVFLMPHVVEQAQFPLPVADTGRLETPWAVHQAQVTVDFARHNRILTWLLGGLNYHKEHHLFPLICHVNYPAMSTVVEQTCRDFGVPYKEHASFRAGLASHYRWLRRMGAAD